MALPAALSNLLEILSSPADLHSKFQSDQGTPNRCKFTQFRCKLVNYTCQV